MVSNVFYFHPNLGKIPILTIFELPPTRWSFRGDDDILDLAPTQDASGKWRFRFASPSRKKNERILVVTGIVGWTQIIYWNRENRLKGLSSHHWKLLESIINVHCLLIPTPSSQQETLIVPWYPVVFKRNIIFQIPNLYFVGDFLRIL